MNGMNNQGVGIEARTEKRRKSVIRPPGGSGGIGARIRRPRRARVFVRRAQVVALVLATGAQSRLGGEAKAFLRLDGRTLIERVVDRLSRCVGTVRVAMPGADIETGQRLLGARAEVVRGEPALRDSLRNLLDGTTAPLLLLHDISFPFASSRLTLAVIAAAEESGAAAAVMPVNPPFGWIDGERRVEAEVGRRVVLGCSPAAFERELLARALERSTPAEPEHPELSAWELVEQSGSAVVPVESEKWNIRIATALDWQIARKVIWPAIRRRQQLRRPGVREKPTGR